MMLITATQLIITLVLIRVIYVNHTQIEELYDAIANLERSAWEAQYCPDPPYYPQPEDFNLANKINPEEN